MAISAKERKLSRLGSCKGGAGVGGSGGGGGSPAARGHRSAAAAGPQRRLFAALFAFLCAGVVVLGGVHVIGGEAPFPFPSSLDFLHSSGVKWILVGFRWVAGVVLSREPCAWSVGKIINDLCEKKNSFFDTNLVCGWCSLLGGEKKSRLLFVGVAIDLMGSYHSRQNCNFSLGFLRLLVSSWEHEHFILVVVLRLTDW